MTTYQNQTSRGHKATALWNQILQTNRIIPNNKLDIITHHDEGTCMLIDDAISGDRIVIKKYLGRW
jgi:hypothetical protein